MEIMEPENGWFPKGISLFRGPFSGSMLVFRGSNTKRYSPEVEQLAL